MPHSTVLCYNELLQYHILQYDTMQLIARKLEAEQLGTAGYQNAGQALTKLAHPGQPKTNFDEHLGVREGFVVVRWVRDINPP